jgi:hypothetical protein
MDYDVERRNQEGGVIRKWDPGGDSPTDHFVDSLAKVYATYHHRWLSHVLELVLIREEFSEPSQGLLAYSFRGNELVKGAADDEEDLL